MKHRRGLSLVELLATIAIIAILIALLLPAVQQARASAARTACQNNLKQLGLGLLGYDNANGRLPPGVTSTGNASGDSFFVYLLPYVEQMSLFSRYELAPVGSLQKGIYWNTVNQELLRDKVVPAYRCPASPLPTMAGRTSTAGLNVQQSDYIGIAGAADSLIPGFNETRTQTGSSSAGCCGGSTISGGGVLFPNSAITFGHLKDGATSTLMVSEVADWLNQSTKRVDWRSGHGWAMGYGGGSANNLVPPRWCTNNSDLRMFNCVTIRYGVNQVNGWSNNCSDGVCGNHGGNQPLRSAHPGGVLGVFCDGSVRFLDDFTALSVLAQLATRDDGTIVSPP